MARRRLEREERHATAEERRTAVDRQVEAEERQTSQPRSNLRSTSGTQSASFEEVRHIEENDGSVTDSAELD